MTTTVRRRDGVQHHRSTDRIAAFSLRFPRGSRTDPPGLEGLSHFYEHLLFSGTSREGRGEIVSMAEAMGGYIAARTDMEDLHVWGAVHDDGLPALLRAVTRAVVETPDLLSDERVRLERAIVHRELQDTVLTRPYGDWDGHVNRAVHGGTSYGHSVIGTASSIDRITVEAARDFAMALGSPSIALRSREPRHARLVERLGSPPPPSVPARQAAALAGPRSESWPAAGQPPLSVVGFLLPPSHTVEYWHAWLLAQLLSSGTPHTLDTLLCTGSDAVGDSAQLVLRPRYASQSVGLIRLTRRSTVSHAEAVAAVQDAFERRCPALVGGLVERRVGAVRLGRAREIDNPQGVVTEATEVGLRSLPRHPSLRHLAAAPPLMEERVRRGLDSWRGGAVYDADYA